MGFRVDMGKVEKKRIFKNFPDEESAKRFQTQCLKAEAKKRPVDLRDEDEGV